MSRQSHRLGRGGEIDRSRPLHFSFDGRGYQGYAGDTLASALLANGVRLVGRSFKYHRPRGIFTAGAEEPSALVELGDGEKRIPNCRATQVWLYDGLTATSQNRWPSLGFDMGEAASLVSPLLPAGFYYKTFMWPRGAWRFYEHFIRRAAGLGRAPEAPSGAAFDSRYAHCDVLVAGGGPAGLSAALAAARAGARVVLADEDMAFGGWLLSERAEIGGGPGRDWVAASVAELQAAENVTLLPRTTAFGYYDDNMIGMVQRLREAGVGAPPDDAPAERLWKLRARAVVIATGAIERPLVFPDNDRPGVMLAGAAQAYVHRFAVQPGWRAVIFTNNDSGHVAARDLKQAGIEIAAVVDLRREDEATEVAVEARLPCRFGAAVVNTRGRQRLRAVEVMQLDASGTSCLGGAERIDCDLLCVSGGWTPTLHLHAQAGGIPRYDELLAAFVPGDPAQGEIAAGAANGRFDLAACLSDGALAGAQAAARSGFGDGMPPMTPEVSYAEVSPAPRPVWEVPAPERFSGKRFVDIQNDVTSADVKLAAREGFQSVEHLKRYTTLGMGTDQGKTSNVNGLAIMAAQLGQTIPETGTTTFRPPYTPVTVEAIAGHDRERRFDPLRRTPMHAWHQRFGAVFMPAGLWQRAQAYPRRGESFEAAVYREAKAVRETVGLVDVSTLGKIDLQGPDAAEFLNRVYVNGWKRLPVGKARYGIMLREDGVVLDDGTTTRIGEERYHMTTTTGGAAQVMAHLQFHLEMVWPKLRVFATSVSEQWAAMALAGPFSRRVLERVTDIDVSNEALPFMGYAEGEVAGVPARIFRISFSGELGFEINVPAEYGLTVWQTLMMVGEPFAIAPYGVEAMDVLRVEKGHLVVGADIDGRVVPGDVGLEGMVSTKKDFIGRRMLEREAFAHPDRLQLVGLEGVEAERPIPAGSHLVDGVDWTPPRASQGRVTSPAFSPACERPIALALLKGGQQRHGERLYAVSPLTGERAEVTVGPPVFVDPEGTRVRS